MKQKRLLSMLVLLVAVVSGAWAQAQTYTVTLQEGTEDATSWTITPAEATTTGVAAGTTVTATYSGTKKVKSVKAVKKAAYLKWDADQQKLVETEIPAEVTMVENADQNVTWAAGTYVVEGNVTIKGGIILNGNVELIIKDGAILTANQIYDNGSNYYNLSIYGQANKSGQLVVNSSDHAISGIRKLEVHSCKVKATSTLNRGGGFYRILTFNVYGGSVDAENTAGEGYGINLYDDSPMNIFGGEVKAVGKGNGDKSYGIMCASNNNSANVKVYGGKLWAECATNKALKNINLTTEAGFTGKIEYSSDKSTWSKTADADAKYVRIDPDANAYLKWDPDQKKLVTTEIPEEVTMVQNANQDVTWAAGNYVVDGKVTINGKITLDGDVNLIIKDGATLTVNKYIDGSGWSSNYNLSIYGQANKSGQLVVNYSNFDNDAIFKLTTLEVHSCQVKATSSYNDCGGFSDIVTFNVYGGSVDAENTGSEGYGIYLKNNSGSMNIYGGDVKVVGTGNHYGFVGYHATVTVHGGKLWAKSAGHQALSGYTNLTKGDGFNGKIETSDDGNDWTEYKEATTPETKYVRAGY